MAGESNYEMKYKELKAKWRNSVDMAFRLGYEQGMQQSQTDSANQMQAQAAMQPGQDPSKVNNNGAPGVPDQGSASDKSGAPSVQPEPTETPEAVPMADSEHPEGSELDQHIAKLESMLSKSEEFDLNDLKKTIDNMKSLQKSYKEQLELKKSAAAIPAIAKALHKPQYKFGVQAQHNLTSTAKSAVTMHHKIVEDVLNKWEQEEKRASKDIISALNIENITKG